MISTHRRIVITGVGVVCPLGNSATALWEALVQERSGVGQLTTVPPGGVPIQYAAEARQFQGKIEEFGPLEKEQTKAIRKGLKVMCRECQMGVAAAQLAMSDAGLAVGRMDPVRTGIAFASDYMISMPEEFTAGIAQCVDGSGRFNFARWPTEGMPKMSPLWLLKYLPNMPASHLAIYNDLRGPNNSLTVREAGANMAVAEAFQTILRGSAEVMIVGATGTRTHPLQVVRALQHEQLALGESDPARVLRPFDARRSGMILGEGAGGVILEELHEAQARGAKIYGEVLAGASSAAAGRKMVAHRRQALINVLRAVLNSARVSPDDVGHIHAHGLSTQSCDAEEAQAIRCVFGSRDVPVVAAKSYFGNLGAGSGLVELVASLLALEHNRLFPVLNFESADPECPVAVVRDGQTPPGELFINLSVTPQGQASAVLVRRMS